MPKLYTFINARSDALLVSLQTLHYISIPAQTEQQAREMLAGFPLVFVSCKPLPMLRGAA